MGKQGRARFSSTTGSRSKKLIRHIPFAVKWRHKLRGSDRDSASAFHHSDRRGPRDPANLDAGAAAGHGGYRLPQQPVGRREVTPGRVVTFDYRIRSATRLAAAKTRS
jgi:hypothetical protein